MTSTSYLQLLANILIPLIIGVWSLYYLWGRIREDNRILSKGLPAEGTIFDFADADSYESSSNNLRYPIIRFVTQQGEWITEQYHITDTGMKLGDKVKIAYDPEDPRTFLIDGAPSPILIYSLIGLLAAGGILWGLYQLISYLLE